MWLLWLTVIILGNKPLSLSGASPAESLSRFQVKCHSLYCSLSVCVCWGWGLFTVLFTYFWLCWVSIAVWAFFLVAESGSYSLLQCVGFSLQWLLLLWSQALGCSGFSSCSGVVVHGLSCSMACGILLDRDRTCISCIGKQILIHCATREVLDHRTHIIPQRTF